MNSILFRIALSGLLSFASLLVILFRVSPYMSPSIALPFFFITLFLTIASASSLLLYGIWGFIPLEGLDTGRKLTLSLREGIFIALSAIIILAFLILSILTWWVALLVIAVFALIEAALHV